MRAPAIRAELVQAARGLEQRGLLSLTAGNLSARLAEGMIAITPSGMPYGEIEPDDIVICDLEGAVVEGTRRPSSELPFHTSVLRARPDVGAVVHTHSLYATTLAVLGRPIPPVHYVIAGLGVDTVPLVPYHTFGSPELAAAITAALKAGGHAVLLANHGALALGPGIPDAVRAAELLEFLATIYYRALSIGDPVLLPTEEIAKVMGRYQDYGQRAVPANDDGHG